MKITDSIGLVLKGKPVGVISTRPNATVYDALSVMAEYGIGAVLVMEEDGRLAGILSERDYARKGVLRGHLARQTQVKEIMTSPVTCVSPRHTVDECMNLMTEGHFRHLPVVDGQKVTGLVSIGDLVKWVISGQARAIQELQGYITGAYPN